MEDDNKIARIGFFTLHISYSLHFQHTKHTMFKILTSTNNYGHNRTTLRYFHTVLQPQKYKDICFFSLKIPQALFRTRFIFNTQKHTV
jgi:hypothetical protein